MRRSREFKMDQTEFVLDTIIAYFLGVISLIFILLSIVKSIASGGHVQRVYGVLLVSSLLMSLTGMVFAAIGYRNEMGSVLGKRISVLINILAFVISGVFMLKGL